MSTLILTIRNTDSILFDGEVDAITSVNERGTFDILAQHENFICLIKEKVVIHNGNDRKEFPLSGGVLKAQENKISIFMGIEALTKGSMLDKVEKR